MYARTSLHDPLSKRITPSRDGDILLYVSRRTAKIHNRMKLEGLAHRLPVMSLLVQATSSSFCSGESHVGLHPSFACTRYRCFVVQVTMLMQQQPGALQQKQPSRGTPTTSRCRMLLQQVSRRRIAGLASSWTRWSSTPTTPASSSCLARIDYSGPEAASWTRTPGRRDPHPQKIVGSRGGSWRPP